MRWEKRQLDIQRVSSWMKKARKEDNVESWAGAMGQVGACAESWGNYAPPHLKVWLQKCYDECDLALGGQDVFKAPKEWGMTTSESSRASVVATAAVVAERNPPRLEYTPPDCKIPRLPSARWRNKKRGKA